MGDRLLLGVNIDHIATLRQARGTDYPDPVTGAFEALAGGADFITLHLREDRRHIQDRDVEILRHRLDTRLNLEMAATDEMVEIARRVKPTDCTLVPEKRQELTTEGGLDVRGNRPRIQAVVASLSEAGIRVSLFIDPDREQLACAKGTGAAVVELHTGKYAETTDPRERAVCLQQLRANAKYGQDLGLRVNAGHGLQLGNLAEIAAIPQLVELNIGHAIIARALFVGLRQAVQEIRQLMDRVRDR